MDVSWTDRGNRFTAYESRTIRAYALNIYTDICRLFLNKTGRGTSQRGSCNEIPLRTYEDNYLKKENDKCRRGGAEFRTLTRCWRECKMPRPLWKTGRWSLRTTAMKLPCGQQLRSQGRARRSWKQALETIFVRPCSCSIIHNNQEEVSQATVPRWTEKRNTGHTHDRMSFGYEGGTF